MHPINCRCVVCLVDRSSFGTDEAKAARESVSDEQAARVAARATALAAQSTPTNPTHPSDTDESETSNGR